MIANIPVLDPERNIAIETNIKIIIAKYFSTVFALEIKNKPIGDPIDRTAAKPAGLSKLPVIANLEWLDGSQPKN